MQREWRRIAAALAFCLGISAVVQLLRESVIGTLLPSIAVEQTVQTAGLSLEQANWDEVTEVFSDLLLGDGEVISVSSSSELPSENEEE